MLREIITPQTQDYTVKIPLEYLNTKVEILVLPLDGQEFEMLLVKKKYTKQEMLKRLADLSESECLNRDLQDSQDSLD